MSTDITKSGAASAQSINHKQCLPVWNVPSRMAFHIIYDVNSGPKHPAIRRPYKDTSRPATRGEISNCMKVARYWTI